MGNNREGEAAVVIKRGTSEVFETKTVAHQETKRTRGVAMALCRRMSASMPLFEPLFQPAAMHQLLFQQPTGLSSGRPTAAMQVVEHEHEYRVEIDAPGLAPSDIKVAIDDGILSSRGSGMRRTRRRTKAARWCTPRGGAPLSRGG